VDFLLGPRASGGFCVARVSGGFFGVGWNLFGVSGWICWRVVGICGVSGWIFGVSGWIFGVGCDFGVEFGLARGVVAFPGGPKTR
jgi:hypothetical protein